MYTHTDSSNQPTHQTFADINNQDFNSVFVALKNSSHPQSELLEALMQSHTPKIAAEELCQLVKISSITDLTISLALLSEALCELLSISPLSGEPIRDRYLDLILESGPDYDFDRKGITLTLNSALFEAINQIRSKPASS